MSVRTNKNILEGLIGGVNPINVDFKKMTSETVEPAESQQVDSDIIHDCKSSFSTIHTR